MKTSVDNPDEKSVIALAPLYTDITKVNIRAAYRERIRLIVTSVDPNRDAYLYTNEQGGIPQVTSSYGLVAILATLGLASHVDHIMHWLSQGKHTLTPQYWSPTDRPQMAGATSTREEAIEIAASLTVALVPRDHARCKLSRFLVVDLLDAGVPMVVVPTTTPYRFHVFRPSWHSHDVDVGGLLEWVDGLIREAERKHCREGSGSADITKWVTQCVNYLLLNWSSPVTCVWAWSAINRETVVGEPTKIARKRKSTAKKRATPARDYLAGYKLGP